MGEDWEVLDLDLEEGPKCVSNLYIYSTLTYSNFGQIRWCIPEILSEIISYLAWVSLKHLGLGCISMGCSIQLRLTLSRRVGSLHLLLGFISYLSPRAYYLTQYHWNQIVLLADKILFVVGAYPLSLGYITFQARPSQAIEVSLGELFYLPHSRPSVDWIYDIFLFLCASPVKDSRPRPT